MNAIDAQFQKLRSQRQRAFIPFVTAGDPNLDATTRVVHELADKGAHLIEIGFPYSDPIADGPVIQASYTRALAHRLHLGDIFTWLGRLKVGVPLVGMVSYSIVHKRGPEQFVQAAREAGLSGLIVPDLPVEESEALVQRTAARELKLIQLVTPTTPRERAVQIARSSTGFLYCVSVTGITGERDRLPPELLDQLTWLRRQTELPLCAGFGISKPEHVRMLREAVDGVIVGSAIVRPLEAAASQPLDEVVRRIGQLTQSLVQALNS